MILGEAKNYATSGRLRIILEGIIKHAEDMLRKQKISLQDACKTKFDGSVVANHLNRFSSLTFNLTAP
jgi:hypothetical protein